MTSVLIIGAGGFIGRSVCKMVGDKAELIGFDIAPPPFDLGKINWVTGSIADTSLVASAAEGRDTVIFLANASLPASSQGDLAYEAEAHVVATMRVCEICESVGVRQFLFASSGGTVYGYNAPETGLDEEAPTWPRSGYGVSKLSIEHYLRLKNISGKMRTLSLRISNPYGEGQRALRAQGIVAAAMQHVFAGTTLQVWGDGTVERDFVHVSDVARAFSHALDYTGHASVMNVGSGQSVSINDVFDCIRKITDLPLNIEYKERRSFDVQRNKLSVTRARNEMQWQPIVSLPEGLRRTARWWEAQR